MRCCHRSWNSTYACNEHPEEQHDIQLEEQDIPSLAEIWDDFADLSEEPIAFMEVFFGAVRCVCRIRHVVSRCRRGRCIVFQSIGDV